MKRIIALALALLCAFSLVSCYHGYYQQKPEKVEGATNYVQIEMEDGGIIKIELYPDVAPITVGNFKKLVKEVANVRASSSCPKLNPRKEPFIQSAYTVKANIKNKLKAKKSLR